eukprot:4562468-Amphidinium_carterae.2
MTGCEVSESMYASQWSMVSLCLEMFPCQMTAKLCQRPAGKSRVSIVFNSWVCCGYVSVALVKPWRRVHRAPNAKVDVRLAPVGRRTAMSWSWASDSAGMFGLAAAAAVRSRL